MSETLILFLSWWNRGESNPCPNTLRKSFLHVYFWISFCDEAGSEL